MKKTHFRKTYVWIIQVFLLCGQLASEELVSFRKEIAPILLNKCQSCHGPKKAKGKYRTDTFANLVKAGASDVPGITANNLDKSELFYRLTTEDKDERMPADADPLPREEIELFRKWIKQGAQYDAKHETTPLTDIVPPPIHPKSPDKYPASLPVTALCFSPDGELLFSSGYHEVLVWDVKEQKLMARIGNVAERTYSLDISPDGTSLAIASGNPGRLGEVRIFQLADKLLKAVPARAGDVCMDARYNPHGNELAVADADGNIRVLDTGSWDTKFKISNHSDWVYSVRWSPDGNHLISGSRDKTAKVFSGMDGKRVVTYSGHQGAVQSGSILPDGKHALTVADDKRLSLWKIEDGKKVKDVATFSSPLTELVIYKDQLFALVEQKQLALFKKEGEEWKKVKDLRNGFTDSTLSLAVHPDGKTIAIGSFDGKITYLNIEDGQVIGSYLGVP